MKKTSSSPNLLAPTLFERRSSKTFRKFAALALLAAPQCLSFGQELAFAPPQELIHMRPRQARPAVRVAPAAKVVTTDSSISKAAALSLDPAAVGSLLGAAPLSSWTPDVSSSLNADAFLPSVTGKLSAEFDMSVYAGQELLSTEGVQRSFTSHDVEKSAGTFGDLPRFIQTLSGVASDNDQRNDFLVRGGNPSENLFVIDNIEIPSINQLALSNTTGGMFSMLDNSAIRRFTFLDDAYSSRYDQRLSSVVDISTRTYGQPEPRSEAEAGIAGVGGSRSGVFGKNGSFFLSGRSGILQYLTKDIGMNGVPHYRNAFARAENSMGTHDSWWGLSLFGIDDMSIHPDPKDGEETNPFDIKYSGWRNATGFNWQHIFNDRAFAIASIAHTEQTQDIKQTDQQQASALVYSEKSSNSATTLKYDFTYTPRPSLLFEFGSRESYERIGYAVDQPLGLQNPYSESPAPTDAAKFGAHRPATTSGAYADATWNLPYEIHFSAGERFTHWSLDGGSALTSRASIAMPIRRHNTFFSYAEHAQLPPELYLLAFNNLQALKPIRSWQISLGSALFARPRFHLTVAMYSKSYRDYPVAANYPQLSLANIADTFGQAFLMFPMTAQGTGISRGVELNSNFEIGHRLNVTTNATYARSWFAGQDGILRKGNFDIPLSGNVLALWKITKQLTLSARYNASSGRLYTPDNLPLSIEQNRDVYDLNRINGQRAYSYQRLDFRFEHVQRLGDRLLTWHIGLQNALDRKNFYSEIWEPNLGGDGKPHQSVQQQMGRFPDACVKMSF